MTITYLAEDLDLNARKEEIHHAQNEEEDHRLIADDSGAGARSRDRSSSCLHSAPQRSLGGVCGVCNRKLGRTRGAAEFPVCMTCDGSLPRMRMVVA
jgi:hypothetical protein